MTSPRRRQLARFFVVDGYLTCLIMIGVYVRHWTVLVLWFGLLFGLFLGMVVGPRAREVAFLSFLGWLVLGAAIGVTAGQTTWVGFVVMAIVIANYLAYDWERAPPTPSNPKDPAFKDPVFATAALALLAGGILVAMSVAGLVPDVWLGPSCGVAGFALALLAIAIARWRISL